LNTLAFPSHEPKKAKYIKELLAANLSSSAKGVRHIDVQPQPIAQAMPYFIRCMDNHSVTTPISSSNTLRLTLLWMVMNVLA
jgi:hypothetical protein